MSYCNEMSNTLMGKISELMGMSSFIDDDLNKINSLSLSTDINKDALNILNTNLNLDMYDVRSYAGSCLDGIIDTTLLDNINDLYDLIPSGLGLGSLMELLQSILNLNELFALLGLGELIDKINTLLGCLSYSDCNVSNDIIRLYDSYIRKYQGFTGTGFDITEIGIGTPFENISKDIKKISAQVEKTIKSGNTIVPKKYF